MSATFFLGTHQTGWLAKAGVPLFVSDTRLRERVRLPRAAGRGVLLHALAPSECGWRVGFGALLGSG